MVYKKNIANLVCLDATCANAFRGYCLERRRIIGHSNYVPSDYTAVRVFNPPNETMRGQAEVVVVSVKGVGVVVVWVCCFVVVLWYFCGCFVVFLFES